MAINNLPAVIPQSNLAALAATIRAAHQGALRAEIDVIEFWLTAGDALITAKAAHPY